MELQPPDAPAGRGRPGAAPGGGCPSPRRSSPPGPPWQPECCTVVLRYAAFRRRTARWCTPAGTSSWVYACALLSSPALTGLLQPHPRRGWRRSGGPLPWPMRPCTPAAQSVAQGPAAVGVRPPLVWSGCSAGRRSGTWTSRRRRAGRPGRGVAAEVRRGPALLCAGGSPPLTTSSPEAPG